MTNRIINITSGLLVGHALMMCFIIHDNAFIVTLILGLIISGCNLFSIGGS